MKTLFFCLLLTIYYLLFTNSALAQATIDGSVVPYRPIEQVSQIAPVRQTMHGLFKGENYKIQVGFENIETESPFHLSISENLINYGKIAPTDPVSRTNIVTISAPSSQKYTLQVQQNHSLKHDSSQTFIPDTTCDNGLCNESVAQVWTGALTYGFGYRCDPISTTNHCLSSFFNTNSYKSFPGEAPQIVLHGASKSSAQITFKVNIPGTQAPEHYSNEIIFIAVPNF